MAKAKAKAKSSDSPPADIFSRKHIIELSPDDASIPAAEKVLKKGGFGTVEATTDGKGWWVVCQGLTDVYQVSVRVDGNDIRCECTCPSPKHPCKHALALLLYLSEHPEQRAAPEAPKHAASDFEPLVRSVFQNSEDDTPRLVFADWLEENDQPDRAALIRLQVEATKHKSKSKRGTELALQAYPLVKQLLATVGTLPEGVVVEFRRGFLYMTANFNMIREIGSFPARFTNLFRDGWVETVRAQGFFYDTLNENHTALFGFVGELDFTNFVFNNDDAMVSLVAHTADMRAGGRLVRVKVAKNNQKAFDELSAAQRGESVTPSAPTRQANPNNRHRHHHGLTRQTLELLIRAGRFHTAQELTLEGNVDDAGTESLAAADMPNLTQLNLRRWNLGTPAMAALANSQTLARLDALSFASSEIGPAAMRELAQGTSFPELTAIDFEMCKLSDAALDEFTKATRFHELKSIHLQRNELSVTGVGTLLRSANFPALTSVIVGSNPLEYRGLLALLLSARERPELTLACQGLRMIRTLGKNTLRIHLLDAEAFNDQIFDGFTTSLAAKRVTTFAASRTVPTQKGLKALANSFSPNVLKEIELRDMRLKNDGLIQFLAEFATYRLETLRLPMCQIQASGIAALAASPLLDSVKTLDLTGNAIGKAGTTALTKSEHLGNLEKLEITDWRVSVEERKLLKAKFGKKLVM